MVPVELDHSRCYTFLTWSIVVLLKRILANGGSHA